MLNLCEKRNLRITKLSDCVQKLDFSGESTGQIKFALEVPCINMEAVWCPANPTAALYKKFQTSFVGNTPLLIYCDNAGNAVCTIALSEIRREASVRFFVVEETAHIRGEFSIDTKDLGEKDYSLQLYIDNTPRPFYDACERVVKWWEEVSDAIPCPVPDIAYHPFYSTWYSFHQDFTAKELEEECKRAKALGMDAIITDDGWQTDDTSRGYAYCGDWNVSESKIPDMKKHVETVHKLGMKYVLWYAVPFIGELSPAWSRFENKFLYTQMHLGHKRGILDPRFPDVREHIINTYEKALRDWDLDGFKLDFIQYFFEKEYFVPDGADYISVQEAAERLTRDIYKRLHAIKPDILIEYRQDYSAPAMKKYANFFRVGDCANIYLSNRRGITQLRLLGHSCVHSDMIMWNIEDSAENAALQLLNSIFGVIQFSMRIDQLPERHREMAAFWLKFAKDNRDILLHGKLRPTEPQSSFPLIRSDLEGRSVIAVYLPDRIADLENAGDITLINATCKNSLLIRSSQDFSAEISVYDCTGKPVSQENRAVSRGITEIPIPPSGLAHLTKQAF